MSGKIQDRRIRSYIRRANKTCSSQQAHFEELRHVKQILENNGFTNSEIDREIKILTQNNLDNDSGRTGDTHNLFYANQMSSAHKTDERVLRQIISRNVNANEANAKIKVNIYYKNKKVHNLVMKNNPTKPSLLQSTNVVYKYSCPNEDCKLRNNVNYIGMTVTTLSRRLTCHLNSGGPRQHLLTEHSIAITRTDLVENTTILRRCGDATRLAIAEALYILEESPVINGQCTNFARTLKLFN